MNISDTINIILSVLSFVLALISVVTVIITLRQNGKMIKNNEDQIVEMRNEHRMSLQPVLYFSNPKYCLERPRLFYTPPTNEYSIRSRCHFFVDVENISSAVAVNINCNAYVAINEDKTEIFDLSTTKRIKVLSDEKIRIEFMFPGDFQEKIYNSLREMNSIKRPHIFITAIYSNTTGGHFYIKNGYHIYVDEYEKIKCWHSIVASAEVEYKSELNYLRRTGKKNQLFERIKKQVEESAGDEKYIEFECVDMMDIFKYGIITEEEYLKKLKECHYPTYVGNLNAGCINKEQSSEEKRSNC